MIFKPTLLILKYIKFETTFLSQREDIIMKEKVLKSRVTVYLHTVIISNYVIINNEML